VRANIGQIALRSRQRQDMSSPSRLDNTPANNQFIGVSDGQVITRSVSSMIFRSDHLQELPMVVASALPSNGLQDGRLIRVAITANAAGPVSIGQMTFAVTPGGNANVSGIQLYGFSDASSQRRYQVRPPEFLPRM